MMTRRILALAALAVASCAQLALGLPDLVVSQLEITPATPTNGTLVTVAATIENVGYSDADGPFFVRFAVDGQQIDLISLMSLGGGRSVERTTTWSAIAGPHALSVEIDGPFNRVDEADERNNTRSLQVNVRLAETVLEVLEPLRIAIARFDDSSGAGFVNVGEGVADALADRFEAIGLRILDRSELDAILQSNELNPSSRADVASAGRRIGADLLILGSVLDIGIQEGSLSLGFLRVDSASANVRLSAEVVDADSARGVAAVSAEGQHEGTTGFSIDIGQLLSFLTTGSAEVCSGELQVDRAWYNPQQTVRLGYRNDTAPAWFGIEMHSSTGTFLRWLGWEFVGTGECGSWFWDQRTASGLPISPGIYTAKLWDGTSYIDTVAFQIRPGIGLSTPDADEITVGHPDFDETVVGTAMGHAIDRLTAALLLSLEGVASQPLDRAAPTAMPSEETRGRPQEGQIAAILPDGRVAINLGASSGVATGDLFEVLEVENLIVDPQTSKILAYDVLSVKGEITVTEAREQVSYATLVGGFDPIIGDVVRGIP